MYPSLKLAVPGSPPPMRGKVDVGIMEPIRNQDHPRLCGEKPDWDGLDKTAQGSPPPMRGKGQPNTRSSVTSGITPAYAGKSRKFSRPVWVTGDHPRLCGEKRFLLIKHMFVYGSPPPMRGKGGYISPPLSRVGITPAYAGKSITKLTESAMCQDHPRLCGEK